jgi:hypothetical protein
MRRAAEVSETLTDDEILSMGRRLRAPAAEWLRQAASAHVRGESTDGNMHVADWVVRLMLEERGHTFDTNPNLRLGPRNQSG